MPGNGNRSGGATVRPTEQARSDGRRDRGLPAGVSMSERSDGSRSYSFSQGGKTIKFDISSSNSFGSAYVGFKVGDSYDRGGLQGRDADRAALMVARIFKHDVSTRPNGYVYSTSAWTADGYGSKRAAAYERAGFSVPSSGRPGNPQYGIVKDGKLSPISGREAAAAARQADSTARDAFLESLL